MSIESPHRADKRFGQNFLHDPRVLARIVAAIAPKPDDHLIEIGPGLGALSLPLRDSGARLDVIEIDRRLIAPLQQRLDGSDRVTVHLADALKTDLRQLARAGGNTKLRLVGNLPYNISTPLLFHVLAFADTVHDMHFMLQKEVVDRMCASPGGKDYGRLTVALAARASVRHLFDVAPGAFRPAPKVTSAIVRISPHEAQLPGAQLQTLDVLLRTAFSKRRKTLANALAGLATAEQLQTAGIAPTARAETVAVDAWLRLSEVVRSAGTAEK